MIRFSIVTLFPEIVEPYLSASILGRAQKQGAVSYSIHNLRDWTTDKHHTADDKVFGGNPGMLLKIEPLYRAIKDLKQKAQDDGYLPWVIATAASGDLFTQEMAKEWATSQVSTDYIIICGRYEGFDARIAHFINQKVGIGPYILTGGELGALVMVDATVRLLPGVLGNDLSTGDETHFSFENNTIQIDGEYPQYTMPAEFTYSDETGEHILKVPEILRSGHHKNIQTENHSRRTKKTVSFGK